MIRKVSLPKELSETTIGAGVSLRSPKWADFEDWVTLRRENRQYLTPWEPEWNELHLTRSAYKAKLVRFKKMMSNDEAYPFYIFRSPDQRLIGACNITHIERNVSQSAKLGYWVGENYTRQGFARAAVKASLRFCFDELRLHRVEAAVQSGNTASIRVLNAAGFQKEGTARGYLKIDGKWRDHEIFAKLSTDSIAK